MRRLLAFKIRTNKFFGTIQGTLGEVITDANSEEIDISTNTLSVNLNKVEHAGTTVNVKVLLLSNEVKHQFVALKALHSFQEAEDENPLIINVSIEIKDGQTQQARDDISNALGQLPLPFSVVTEGHKVQVGVKVPALYKLPVD